MDRHDLLEHIRRRILGEENKTSSRKSHGVEKVTNKARKFRLTCHEVPYARNTFESNVLRKVQSIRTSTAFKQCCERLNSCEGGNVLAVTNLYSSMPSLCTSKNVLRVEQNSCERSIDYFRSEQSPIDNWRSGSCGKQNSPKRSAEKPRIMKAVVDVSKFLRSSKMNSHLPQPTRCTEHDMDEIEKGTMVQPLIAAEKSSDAFNCSTKNETISQHVNLNISGHGHSSSCDDINVKIKQSFNTLNDLENDIDNAAHFLQASFSNRVSIPSRFECSKMDGESSFSFEGHTVRKRLHEDHLFPKQNIKGMTCGKTLGCRLKTYIAYGRNVAEMSQHLRHVRDAFSRQALLHKHEVSDGMMNQSSQRPLKERNYDLTDLRISSFSKTDSIQDDHNDTKNIIGSKEPEIMPQMVLQKISSDMEVVNESSSGHSILADASQSDEVNSSPTYALQELRKRENYAGNTVKALRQFYKDSMLYFAELRKLYRQKRVEDLWKVENEEERIKAACLLLKRKYIDSVSSAMSMKNFMDYHLHETARIQLLNLDLQKHFVLLRGSRRNLSFEKFRRGSEKVLLFTKDFEKNNLASELERWERKLTTRFKIDGDVANSENTKSLFSNPLRIVRNAQEAKVQRSYNRNLQQLREELKWKRREADFLKRAFDQRAMRNDQSNENSLRAQISAHERYIAETEKDIAQLINLQNRNDDNNERSTVVPEVKYESYLLSSSKFASTEAIPERASYNGEFSKPNKSGTSFNADVQPTNKSCSLESNSMESCPFFEPVLEQKSGIDSFSNKKDNAHPQEKTHTSYSVELSPIRIVTPAKLASSEQLTGSLKSNYSEKKCSTSNEAPLSIDNTLLCSQDIPIVSKEPAHLSLPESNHSNELIYGETGSFKQDTSKEALLLSVEQLTDSLKSNYTSYFEVGEQSAVQLNNAVDDNETTEDRCNLYSSVGDERFFTPMQSDVEADNDEKSDNGVEKATTASQESSSSFHTTISSPVPDEQVNNKIAQRSVRTLSPSSKKFELVDSPLASSKRLISTAYAASMPRDNSTRSPKDSLRTLKTAVSRSVPLLSSSLLESLLDDSLTTMLMLNRSGTVEDETFVLHDGCNKLAGDSATLLTNSSWQSDQTYDLNRIPVPEDLIPGLDLSCVNSAEENDLSSRPEEASSSVEIRADRPMKSVEPMSEFRYYLGDEKWVVAELHSVSEQIWNLASLKQPLKIVVSDSSGEIASQEVQMRQMIADRCCEIARCYFKNVGGRRYMGLTSINCPRNLLHLKDILQKQFSKYYGGYEFDVKGRKRWELLSQGCTSDIENIVLEELYEEQRSWEDILERYENEIKTELISELWHEQLDESLSTVVKI